MGGLAGLALGQNLSPQVWHLCGQVREEQVTLAQIQQPLLPRPGGRDPNAPGAAAALAMGAIGAACASESSCKGASQMAMASSISCLLDHGITPWDSSCRAFRMSSILSGCESGSLPSRSRSWT